MRSVPEWIGKTDDTPVPPRVQDRVYTKFDGKCAGCGRRLHGKRWTCDHVKALINGGENRESNLQPLGDDCCNKAKNKADVAVKSKTYRLRKHHRGIRKPSRFKTARTGRFKKKLPSPDHPYGQLVRR